MRESFLETKFNHHSDYSNEKPTRHNPDPDVRVLSTGSLSCRRSPAKVFTLFKVSSLNLKQLKLARLVTLIIRLGQYKWTNSPRSRSKSAENWVNEINCFSWTLTPRSNHGPNIIFSVWVRWRVSRDFRNAERLVLLYVGPRLLWL